MSKRVSLSVVKEQVQDCAECGACCEYMCHPPFMRDDVGLKPEQAWVGLPQDLRNQVLLHHANHPDYDGPCMWLADNGTCRHYEHRPQACRDFKVGSKDCLDVRRMRSLRLLSAKVVTAAHDLDDLLESVGRISATVGATLQKRLERIQGDFHKMTKRLV